MSKIFYRLFFVLFFSLSSLALAQDTDKPPTQEQMQDQKNDDLFNPMDAPYTYKGAFVKMMVTLLALIILIVVTVWMLRRISHGRLKQMNYGRSIKILERRPLSAKSILYLVEISGKKVVVAESQLEVRAITTVDHLTPDEE